MGLTAVGHVVRCILTPVGSGGDVHPFVGVGLALARRGHEAIVVTAEPFREVVEGNGLAFRATVSARDYRGVEDDPLLWHPRRGVGIAMRAAVAAMPATWAALEELYEPGRTVLVGHSIAFATRCFEEKRGAPAATVHLSPLTFRSEHAQPAVLPGVDLSRAPRAFKRALWRHADRVTDAMFAPQLNAHRAQLGLPPVRRVFESWLHSPRRVVGLFPDWYGPPQPDWPAQTRLAGFPRFDDATRDAPDRRVEAFLDSGPPPVVFTPGTAHRHAAGFFREAVEAARRIGRRALLLTRHAEQVPSPLPPHALHAPYAPFSRVLPRAAAVVHHGGIGSCAQGLAAGIPQLLMPMAFDQPDNAMRLRRLGVGRWIVPRRFTARRVAHALARMLDDEATAAACRRWAEAARGEDGAERAAEAILEVAAGA